MGLQMPLDSPMEYERYQINRKEHVSLFSHCLNTHGGDFFSSCELVISKADLISISISPCTPLALLQ